MVKEKRDYPQHNLIHLAILQEVKIHFSLELVRELWPHFIYYILCIFTLSFWSSTGQLWLEVRIASERHIIHLCSCNWIRVFCNSSFLKGVIFVTDFFFSKEWMNKQGLGFFLGLGKSWHCWTYSNCDQPLLLTLNKYFVQEEYEEKGDSQATIEE